MKVLSGIVGEQITLQSVSAGLGEERSVILSTLGGDLWEAWAIHDYIKQNNLLDEIGCLGMVASSGTVLMLSAPTRWATSNSSFLIHNPWNMGMGDSTQFKKTADELEKSQIQLAAYYSEVSGRPVEEIQALMNEERVLSAQEALALNLITEIRDINNLQIQNEMTDKGLDEKLKAHEESLMQRIQNFFKGGAPAPVKNAILQDVTGAELDFGDAVETIDDVEVGTTATVSGSPAVGEYVFANGKTYVFEAGAVTQIIDPVEEVEALKSENTELAGQVAAAQTEIQNKAKEIERLRADYEGKLTAIKNEFSALKNQYNPEPPTAPGAPAGDPAEGVKRFVYKGKK